jgi:hypothetical protein
MAEPHDTFTGIVDELSTTFARVAEQVVFGDSRVDDDLLRGEALRYATRLFAAGLVAEVELHDPAYPVLASFLTPWLNWGYTNPDGTYHWACIHGDHTYRLWGNRGSAKLFDIESWYGDLSDMTTCGAGEGRRHIIGGKSDLDIGADGEFEVILSRDEHPGNWIPLREGIGHLYIRQWYYDFDTEQPGQIYIERIGATYPPPPPTAEYHAQRFRLLNDFVQTNPAMMQKGVNLHYGRNPGLVEFPTGLIGSEIAFRNQVYARGLFECRPDDAVIMESEPPDAQYWMFVLMSQFWEYFDWRGRQVSLNGHEMVIDSDGTFRAVIAHRDPGVANWLDPYGHTKGLIGGRYNWTETVPTPTLKTVPFDELMKHLPPDTRTITPAERQNHLRRRLINGRRLNLDW